MAAPTPIRIGGDRPAGFPNGRPLPLPSVAEETLNGAVRTMMALGIVALSMMAMVRVAQASEGRSAGFDGGV